MADPLNDEAEVLDVLRALVAEIAAGHYECEAGPLTMNAAYLDAVALLETRGG